MFSNIYQLIFRSLNLCVQRHQCYKSDIHTDKWSKLSVEVSKNKLEIGGDSINVCLLRSCVERISARYLLSSYFIIFYRWRRPLMNLVTTVRQESKASKVVDIIMQGRNKIYISFLSNNTFLFYYISGPLWPIWNFMTDWVSCWHSSFTTYIVLYDNSPADATLWQIEFHSQRNSISRKGPYVL